MSLDNFGNKKNPSVSKKTRRANFKDAREKFARTEAKERQEALNIVKGKGRLRHRFWGDYSAVIGLYFVDVKSAEDALVVLGNEWKQGQSHKNALVWIGDGEQLKVVKEQLGSFGADVKKIDSVATSIDYGEDFTVEIPIIPQEQIDLNL